MSEPMPPTKLEIAKAAVLRAFGLDWDAIAARLARPADRVRLWPIQFPQIWNHYFRIGSNRHMQIAAAEAVQVIRNHIRQSKAVIIAENGGYNGGGRGDEEHGLERL